MHTRYAHSTAAETNIQGIFMCHTRSMHSALRPRGKIDVGCNPRLSRAKVWRSQRTKELWRGEQPIRPAPHGSGPVVPTACGGQASHTTVQHPQALANIAQFNAAPNRAMLFRDGAVDHYQKGRSPSRTRRVTVTVTGIGSTLWQTAFPPARSAATAASLRPVPQLRRGRFPVPRRYLAKKARFWGLPHTRNGPCV